MGYETAVIIPTYNRWPTVADAVASVIDQGKEVLPIVIDDASTDGTPAHLRDRFGDRVRLIVQPENREKSAARNAGIAAAETEFLCCLDSDDLFEPGGIAALRAVYAADPEFDGLAFGACCLGDAVEIPPDRMPRQDLLQEYVKRPFIHTMSFMIRRHHFDRMPAYHEDLTNLEDVELFIRLMARLEFRNCGRVVSRIRKQDDSASINHAKIAAQGTRLLDHLRADEPAMAALGANFAVIADRVHRELLRAYYRLARWEEYCSLYRELYTVDPAAWGGRFRRRYWVARLRSLL